jgi:hypothetical protein
MKTMTGKARSHTERLARILDNLGDHIRNAPGDELLDTAREEGRDPAEVNARIKTTLLRTFKSYQQKALAEARQGYQRDLASISEGHFHLPKTAEGRRSWFLAVLAQAPQLQPAFTLQNRELSDVSDEDIESHLRKLAQLGVLKAIRLPEEE